MPIKRHRFVKSKGFTLIELLVSILIFMMMTALLIAKYGNFNSNVLLTDAAYDVALAIRQAQTFGVSVKGSETGGAATFSQPYGVHFSRKSPANDSCQVGPYTFLVFAENDSDNECGSGDVSYASYNFKRGIGVASICADEACSSNSETADVVFTRPIPEPSLKVGGVGSSYVKILLQSPDGAQRSVVVRDNGQISIDY